MTGRKCRQLTQVNSTLMKKMKKEAALDMKLIECKAPDRAYIDSNFYDCDIGESATDCDEPKYFRICLSATAF